MEFRFEDPAILLLLLALPILVLLKGKLGQAAAIVFSSVAIAKKVARKKKAKAGRLMLALRLLALGAFIVALARPQIGVGDSYIEANGIDIVLAVDVSTSMLGLDFSDSITKKTRLDVAKEVIEDFIDKREHDRIAMVAFAGNPYLVSPLTLNHDWLHQNLERVEIGLIEDGTAIGSAIGMGVNRLRDIEGESRVIILLTDGVSNRGISPVAGAEIASTYDTKVYTVAVGTGGMVPSYFLGEDGKYVKNVFGQRAVFNIEMPIDVETLDRIAEISGGKSYHASNLEELKDIYKEIDQLEKREVKLKQYAEYDELYLWAMLVGLLFIGLEQFLGSTRYRRLP